MIILKTTPLIFAMTLTSLTTVYSQEEATEEAVPQKPKIEKVGEHLYQIGKIQLDQKKREISFGAGVNMRQGLIEYLLATTKSDKVHETLFLTDISPFNLNVAMKLLSIKESKELFEIVDEETWAPTGKFPPVTPEDHAASLVDILIEWEHEGAKKTLHIHNFINHIEWPDDTDTPDPNQQFETQELKLTLMEEGPWLSTGSYLLDGRLKAEVGGLIFGIYTNEQALVNFPGKDRRSGDVWIPNETIVPKEETVVKIILKPHNKQK